jgi:aspartyl-tRNA synthetase
LGQQFKDLKPMLRTHTCGELSLTQVGKHVTLCGWVQKIRDKGAILWIDLRDRYGITQLIFEESNTAPELIALVRTLGREYVIQAQGTVLERSAKNQHMATGDIEIKVDTITIFNRSQIPPFLIEEPTDAGEELRMRYRYLDLRRPSLQNNILLRHQVMQQVRTYLNKHQFVEIETPMLIKSTPEGARDFIVPSRIHPGQFYALPQSPQLLKQLLMISGFDRYYQLVKCFRDEDLRADRQPEFTQIDCELSFVTREDILNIFEAFIKSLFQKIKNIDLGPFPRIAYVEAMQKYGSDKPDLRLGMPFTELTKLVQGHGFLPFDQAELVIGICVPGCAAYSRKQLDQLTDFVRQPQLGAQGLVYVKYIPEDGIKSSVDKFYQPAQLHDWAKAMHANQGDLLLILAGETQPTQQVLAQLRLKLGHDLGLDDPQNFKPLWVIDFPLLTWDAHTNRYQATHHPFTAPTTDDLPLLAKHPELVRANAYDLVINGMEIGGGSIRIHDKSFQATMWQFLGFSQEEANQQFGFLMEALEYGAPPHGGIAFGLDRLCAILAGETSIRSFMAFPKNNAGKDVMLKAPDYLAKNQLDELGIKV